MAEMIKKFDVLHNDSVGTAEIVVREPEEVFIEAFFRGDKCNIESTWRCEFVVKFSNGDIVEGYQGVFKTYGKDYAMKSALNSAMNYVWDDITAYESMMYG